MAKYKVRHGLITYTAERDGRDTRETAFRGQVVSIRKSEAERLVSLNAIVAEDEELSRPGVMTPLPEAATDEEIRTWVLGATEPEIKGLVASRPILAERVAAAYDRVQADLKNQAEHLGQAKEVAEEAAEEAEEEDDSAPTTATEQVEAEAEAESDADRVVEGNNSEVAKYLSENPGQADAILEAEVRRAQAEGKDPREGVQKAVDAARSHGE